MNIFIKTITALSLIAVLISCNKEKRYSNKLFKGENWKVKSIKIDGAESQIKGNWLIMGDDIYDTVPSVKWQGNAGFGESLFQWQFQDKGDKFQLNYFQLCEECDGTELDSLDVFNYAITGTYDVDRHRNKKMTFTSNKTIGFGSKKVEIEIEKN